MDAVAGPDRMSVSIDESRDNTFTTRIVHALEEKREDDVQVGKRRKYTV